MYRWFSMDLVFLFYKVIFETTKAVTVIVDRLAQFDLSLL